MIIINYFDRILVWQVALEISGVIIDKITKDSIHLLMPRDSYEYKMGGSIDNPHKYAKSISDKGKMLGFIPNDFKVKYRIYDIFWTKEMSKKAKEDFYNKYKRESSK